MKHSGETRPSGKWLLAAIGGSLLLHALMMLVPYSQQPRTTENGRPIRLVSPTTVHQPESEPPSEQDRVSDQAPDVEHQTSNPASAPARATPTERPIVAIPAQESDEATEASADPAPSVEPFSQQVLTSVRQRQSQFDIPKSNDALQAHPVPALPDQPGWLNDYVGTVQAGIDRWQNTDGSRHSRIVLANGQVICGQTRAPSTSELFNPQLSLNIMTFRLCGRERPEPIDRTDPWVRGGPANDSD